MSTANSPPPLPPAVLASRYRLDRRLAQGGMAEVWVATDLSLTRQVAIKVLKPALASDPIVAERFRREAIAVAQLSHPNIVAVYDAVSDGGRQAVVMQLINGKSLRQLLDEQKRLSPDLTIHIGSCVASALDAAHNAGMVHRDVKPGNILITPDGRVLLTDFGIAKALESTGDDLTSDNVMMGTAKYLSPEQVRGRKLDGRADLYSLGLVLYECLAGRVPFLGQNDADTALARLQRDPTDITRLRPTLPYGLADLVHRLLARRPDQRYASGAAVRAALHEVSTHVNDPTWGNDRTDLDRTNPDRTSGHRTPSGTPTDPLIGARDRARTPPAGARQPGPRSNTPAYGYRATNGAGRAAGSPVRPTAERHDRTPAGQSRVQQRPNRTFEQRRSPSMIIVGGLLLAALVIGVILWSTLGRDETESFDGPTTVVTATEVPTTDLTPAVASIDAGINTVVAYDPSGDDGTENDEQAVLAIDGDPATAWNTSCYADQYFNGKPGGVGLVTTLDALATGSLQVDVSSAPWQVKVYASSASTAPTDVAGWGGALASDSGTAAKTLIIPITTPATHLLVSFVEAGTPDSGCSSSNPYRGSISEIRFEPIS